jgi:excisionase family DNA binding protein
MNSDSRPPSSEPISPQASISPRLWDIQEVAAYTGLSVHTLYTMVSQRRIPFVKIGRLTKFDRYEVDKWITGHSVKIRRLLSAAGPLTIGSSLTTITPCRHG